jgi:hypothetical protein
MSITLNFLKISKTLVYVIITMNMLLKVQLVIYINFWNINVRRIIDKPFLAIRKFYLEIKGIKFISLLLVKIK